MNVDGRAPNIAPPGPGPGRRPGGAPFLASLIGGTAGGSASRAARSKFRTSLQRPAERDAEAMDLRNPQQTMHVLFRAFGGELGGPATANAAAALGADAAGVGGRGDDLMTRITQMNAQFLALQNLMQQSQRKGGILKEVLTVRHRMAMNSIGNLR